MWFNNLSISTERQKEIILKEIITLDELQKQHNIHTIPTLSRNVSQTHLPLFIQFEPSLFLKLCQMNFIRFLFIDCVKNSKMTKFAFLAKAEVDKGSTCLEQTNNEY